MAHGSLSRELVWCGATSAYVVIFTRSADGSDRKRLCFPPAHLVLESARDPHRDPGKLIDEGGS